jgi:hypothetical protein
MPGEKPHSSSFDDLPTVGKKLLCGGVAGSVSKTIIAPLERVKILFQVRSHEYPYSGVVNTLRQIVSREGALGLYNGNSSSVLRVFPYAAIQFVSFDFYKKLICPDPTQVPLSGNFFAGALAGATSVIFTYPLDVTRARLAVQVSSSGHRQYTGLFQALRHMWKSEGGLPALYRGAGPTMLGIFPYAGINFFTYHSLKWYYTNSWTDHAPLTTPLRLVFGSCAGILGQTAVYPLDVIRRRMQIEGLQSGGTVYQYRYTSTWHGFRSICTQEGWKALFRGLHINYIKVVPLVSISFTINDLLRGYLGLESSS